MEGRREKEYINEAGGHAELPSTEDKNQIVSWILDPGFYKNVSITLTEKVLGYIIGTGLGVAAGVWLGLSRSAARIL
ncbi:hypothetical protein ACC677_37705, partial [Rhizobium ruizarguesonis]